MGTPERADDDTVFVERVVDVARDFGNVDAAKTSDAWGPCWYTVRELSGCR